MLSKPARHATLILLRHGKSEKHGCIVGWQDPALAERAKLEAQAAGKKIEAAGLVINVAFTSVMTRAEQTCDAALEAAGRGDAPKTAAQELNPLMPGALTGLTKEEANHRYGSDKVLDWRRGWDQRPPALDQEDPRHPSQDPILVERLPRRLPAPSTECFKDVAGRVLPFLENRIMPELRAGKTVLVTAHGNPIRAIAQLLEEGSCRENPKFEVPNTTPMVYSFGPDLAVMSATVPSASGGPSKRGCYLGKRTTVEADLEAFQRYLERGCCPANSWPVHEVQADQAFCVSLVL